MNATKAARRPPCRRLGSCVPNFVFNGTTSLESVKQPKYGIGSWDNTTASQPNTRRSSRRLATMPITHRVNTLPSTETLHLRLGSLELCDLSLKLGDNVSCITVEERHRDAQAISDPVVYRRAEVDDRRLLTIGH